ncbi:response regulator transcription factor [Paenibacillus harenae]|uniref:response regulator transcription factor n=1 Tax=Paenibacillus harenae TaxID=306543 RepID=UPI0027928947|nr:response regulator [Paenibacillus harenae]MDQ0064085.1 two-component system response regulator YesN [Paenibacillus harenae]
MYKVFLVDDEELVIKSLKATVDWKGSGYEVAGYALSGEEAVEAVKRIRPDLIFSDIRMPGMNGLELKKRLDDAGVTAKFIIVSGLAEFALAQKAIQNGISGYCLKPFDEMEITGYLRKLKRELDASQLLPEGEILDMIEAGTPEAHNRLRHELALAGIAGSEEDGLRIMLSVRRDRLTIHEKVPCLTVRIGYRKFIYVMADRDADQLMATFASEGHPFLKGIGFSKQGIDTAGFAQAIQDAELQAYQYFTLAESLAWEGSWQSNDMKSAFGMLAEGDDLAFIAQLDSLQVMFRSGHLNIRHALLLYNDCILQLSRKGMGSNELYLYSFEQLAEQFEDVRDMIDDLKRLFEEEKDQNHHHPVFMHPGRGSTFSVMLEYINEHFGEDITILGLSKQFNLNPNYISQLFRKELDKTFTEYLTGLRMNRASELLRTTSIPINEIADQVGYKDYFYFSKMFKKILGVPPRGYRYDQNQNNSNPAPF